MGNVFNREDVLEAREELLRDLGVDSRASFFRYLQEMIRQANSDSQRETDLGPLLACVQCLCLLFPDDIELMTDIYTWVGFLWKLKPLLINYKLLSLLKRIK